MTEEIITKEKTIETVKPKSCKFTGLKIFFLLLALIIVASGLGYGYFKLSKSNVSLAKTISSLESKLAQNQSAVTELKQSTEALQTSMQKTQDLNGQQEKLLTDWKQAQLGDRHQWKVAQAQYLTNMAQDYLQFSHEKKLALLLLQQAANLLTNIDDNDLLALRQALANDLTNLQAISEFDATATFMQLNALSHQVKTLPLPENALQEKASANAMQPSNQTLTWWRAGLEYSWQALNKIVLVRKTNDQALPLVLPEEKALLYQNVHAQIENAVWGLLHGNVTVYQTSLNNVGVWVKDYFVQDASETKSFLLALDNLQKVKMEVVNSNLSDTLKLFDSYFSQAKTAQP